MKFLEDFRMGYKISSEIWMGYEFFGEKIIFPSTSVPGINNDQSLRYRQNILIARLYEQFSRNDSAMAPEKSFKLLKYEHIIHHFKANDLDIPLI